MNHAKGHEIFQTLKTGLDISNGKNAFGYHSASHSKWIHRVAMNWTIVTLFDQRVMHAIETFVKTQILSKKILNLVDIKIGERLGG